MAGEPGHDHTALALVATGRLNPDTGEVRLHGAADAGAEPEQGATTGAHPVPGSIGALQVAAMFAVTKLALDITPVYCLATALFLVLMLLHLVTAAAPSRGRPSRSRCGRCTIASR